jgi:hypothetical protein
MTSAFIVRPFGKKAVPVKGPDGKDISELVDFDEIDRLLIQPALKQNAIEGKTTGVIAKAGNIREDMFQMLIAYDLVIADITIDNANVFYELGIRHGLRPKGTILLRASTDGRDVPFDLKTDRYMAYDRQDPASAVAALSRAIEETIAATRSPESSSDSPVFLLLPSLVPPDPARLVVEPRAFREAVESAEGDKQNGLVFLALLGEEAKGNAWAREGLRSVGRAQRMRRAFPAARATWEVILRDLPYDVQANAQLATIYQRLGDVVAASQACRRVLGNAQADRKDRADARSQLARNQKVEWVADFNKEGDEQARRRRAITDSRLIETFEGYREGFAEDQNDYYSGINALGLVTAIVALAELEADAWSGGFESSRKAEVALDEYREQLDDLRGAVRVSLQNARSAMEKREKKDEWLPPSEAQFALLTAKSATFVRKAYNTAKNGDGFSISSEMAQVAIFHRLGLLSDNCREALAAIGATAESAPANEPGAPKKPRDRVIVGTGHRVDRPDRVNARFPNAPEAVAKAKAWLRETLEAEKAATAGDISAIAGAASGTDLLFHEVCAELGIPTKVVLPIPKEDYSRESVADGGPDWVERFNRLMTNKPPIVLSNEVVLPSWARTIPDYSVFQRGNIWTMEDALLRPNADVTLIALWNGKAGDGPGGTGDMVELAKSHGAKVLLKNTDELFALGG